MRRDLPIGIQSFEKLRHDGYAYVDKTSWVYELARTSVPYFLSRPRRFGKSLLVSTLRAYFEGKRDLFRGLAIELLEQDDAVRAGRTPWQQRPVFNLSFYGPDYTQSGALEAKLDALLARWEAIWGVAYPAANRGDRLLALLEAAHGATGHRCAVLVDEYDKPLLDAMDDLALVESNRAALKGFYGVLKDADEHLRFVFITGVTKFSKVSIFSDLNQLRDISMSSDFAAACGITEEELLANFGPELRDFAKAQETSEKDALESLRSQYDGYLFHPVGPAVYNPYSLFCALVERELGAYWFGTGTPTFLVRRMRDAGLEPRRLSDGSIYATGNRLSDYRADDPDPVPLLFQTGYLTISAFDPRGNRYALSLPNEEVRQGLLQSLLPLYAPAYGEARGTDVFTLWDLVETGDVEGIRNLFEALFASIPYTREADPFENYFQAVIWLVFSLLGHYVNCEVHQAGGRVDCVVEAHAHVYVFEFKRDGTAEEALAQIKKKGYALAYAADPRKLHCIGCAFDSKSRMMSAWKQVDMA